MLFIMCSLIDLHISFQLDSSIMFLFLVVFIGLNYTFYAGSDGFNVKAPTAAFAQNLHESKEVSRSLD